MTQIENLQNLITLFRDTRDWKQFHNPKDLAVSLLLESAELLEQFQWKDEKEVLQHIEQNKQGVADELADIFFYVLLTSYDLGIDLEEALKNKLDKNNLKYPINTSKGNHKKYTELSK